MRDVIFCLSGIFFGGLITWLVSYLYYKKQSDEEAARYLVMAMLPQHPVKNSIEIQQRIDKFLDAIKRTKKDKHGAPVWREDGTIGVDWKISLYDKVSLHDKVNISGSKEKKWWLKILGFFASIIRRIRR